MRYSGSEKRRPNAALVSPPTSLNTGKSSLFSRTALRLLTGVCGEMATTFAPWARICGNTSLIA
jgi:hypothetical protein